MKLLVGIQGKVNINRVDHFFIITLQIWSSIDVMDYKQAAVHYLSAKHIVSQLCLESIVVTHRKSVLAVSELSFYCLFIMSVADDRR